MRRGLLLMAMAALLPFSAACGDGGTSGQAGGSGDGAASTLIWARGADSSSLDPAVVTDGESVKVITNLFDTLIRFRPGSLELAPGLAESWETSADGLTWTFRLREARFHDGTPVDADAVVFSFERQRDPSHPAHTGPFPYWGDNFGLVTAVEATGPRTVVVRLKAPDAAFEAKMTLFAAAIVSPSAWKSEGTGGDGKYAYRFGEKPVGSGPFRLVRWTRDDSVVVEAFPDHWNGRPGVDRVVFKTISENNQRLLAVESGQADIMDGVNPQHAERVQRSSDLVWLTKPALNVAYLAMNNDKPPFDKPEVRRAVALALNKENIRQAAYDGRGDIATVPVPKGMPGRADDIEDRARDVAEARRLLAAAGLPDGFEVTLMHGDNPRPYMPRPSDVATQIQQDLREAGITVTVRKVQWTQYISDCQNGRHEMCLLGWSADYGDPDNFMYVLLDASNTAKGTANNVSFYRGEAVHRLLTDARVEGDRAKRMQMYRDAQRIVFDEAPMVPLMQMPDIRVANKRVQGYVIYPAGGEYLHSVRVE